MTDDPVDLVRRRLAHLDATDDAPEPPPEVTARIVEALTSAPPPEVEPRRRHGVGAPVALVGALLGGAAVAVVARRRHESCRRHRVPDTHT